jgi:hypothetical protein
VEVYRSRIFTVIRWRVKPADIQKQLPDGLHLDTLDGAANDEWFESLADPSNESTMAERPQLGTDARMVSSSNANCR